MRSVWYSPVNKKVVELLLEKPKNEVTSKILTDLKTLKSDDIKTMYKYYIPLSNIPDLKQLSNAVYNNMINMAIKYKLKSTLPKGTIFYAIKYDNYDDFLEFINSSSFNKDATYEGYTLLTYILYSINITDSDMYIQKLIDKGVDINKNDEAGNNPLIDALLRSKYIFKSLELLLKSGADLNVRDKDFKTPLEIAILNLRQPYKYTTEIPFQSLKLLLDYGAQITPLTLEEACNDYKFGDYSILKVLLTNMDLNLENLKTLEEVKLSAKCNDYIIKILQKRLEEYKDVFSEQEINYLKENCDNSTIKGIIKCLKTARDMYEYHPSNTEAHSLTEKYKEHSYFRKKASLPQGNVFDVIENDDYDSFLEFVNDPSFDKDAIFNKQTLLTFVFNTSLKESDSYIEKLILQGIDVNKQDQYGDIPLILSILSSGGEGIKSVELLLNAGANPNVKDKDYDNKTALEIAIDSMIHPDRYKYEQAANIYTIKLLLDHGAKITPKAFKLGCKDFINNNDDSILKELINNGDISHLNLENELCKEKVIEILQRQLEPFHLIFSDKEIEYLEENCNLDTIDGLYKCLDRAKEMYAYHPENLAAQTLKDKYKTHPYYQKKDKTNI